MAASPKDLFLIYTAFSASPIAGMVHHNDGKIVTDANGFCTIKDPAYYFEAVVEEQSGLTGSTPKRGGLQAGCEPLLKLSPVAPIDVVPLGFSGPFKVGPIYQIFEQSVKLRMTAAAGLVAPSGPIPNIRG